MNLSCIRGGDILTSRAILVSTVYDDVSTPEVIKHRTQSAYDHNDGRIIFGNTRMWRREVSINSQDSQALGRDSNWVPSLYKSRTLLILEPRPSVRGLRKVTRRMQPFEETCFIL
jgi:hypothetical protein